METIIKYGMCGLLYAMIVMMSINPLYSQFPMPPEVPIWDANKVSLTLHKITDDVYAVIPVTAETETTKGIPQATTAGFIIGEKGVVLIETMLSKRLYDQLYTLVKGVTQKPILYAINTSDHGDHCFGNYLLPDPTLIIQNEYGQKNLANNYQSIKQFMVMLFGKDRGIEESELRAADIIVPKDQKMVINMGKDLKIELMNTGTAQSPADLFVYVRTNTKNILWAGNAFIAESPTIPWLFDGFFLEPVANLNKMYNLLGANDVVVPGHGRITDKEGIKFTVDYVNTLKEHMERAIKRGLTLEQTLEATPMKEFDKGYVLFHWLHYNFNLPTAYREIKKMSMEPVGLNP